MRVLAPSRQGVLKAEALGDVEARLPNKPLKLSIGRGRPLAA
jgi:hypothetical protein